MKSYNHQTVKLYSVLKLVHFNSNKLIYYVPWEKEVNTLAESGYEFSEYKCQCCEILVNKQAYVHLNKCIKFKELVTVQKYIIFICYLLLPLI